MNVEAFPMPPAAARPSYGQRALHPQDYQPPQQRVDSKMDRPSEGDQTPRIHTFEDRRDWLDCRMRAIRRALLRRRETCERLCPVLLARISIRWFSWCVTRD